MARPEVASPSSGKLIGDDDDRAAGEQCHERTGVQEQALIPRRPDDREHEHRRNDQQCGEAQIDEAVQPEISVVQ